MRFSEDPRVHEFRAAFAAVNAGMRAPAGASERYRQAQLPYAEWWVENTPDHFRKIFMRVLYEGGMSLGVIAFAYTATDEEMEYVAAHPPLEPEPVDEQQRLAGLPYGVYLKTAHWLNVRKAALERAGGRCSLCNVSAGLEVHHRTYSRRGAERPADVVVLCGSCHTRHHGKLRAA